MKNIGILVLALIVGVLVFSMQTRVRKNLRTEGEALRNEKRSVQRGDVALVSDNGGHRSEGVEEEVVERCLDGLFNLYLSSDWDDEFIDFEGAYDNLLRQMQWFSPSDIARLLVLLKVDARFSDRPDLVEEVFSEFLLEAAPKSCLLFLKDEPHFEDRSRSFARAFAQCLQVDLRWALAYFEEARAAGDPDFQSDFHSGECASGSWKT